MDTSSLGNRMKEYEAVSNIKLTRRTPVIMRLDMCHGHTFTRNFDRPFDDTFIMSMQYTMKYLCAKVQNCVFGYCQSDEISLVLIDDKKLETSPWFDNKVEKICSVGASLATVAFNKFFAAFGYGIEVYAKAIESGAVFDCRAFNLPKEEVTNCIYWRQQDATRNSIQMMGQAYFPHKQLHGKSCNDIQDMLFTQHGINWNDLPTYKKRGAACRKTSNGWFIDNDMPILRGEGRDYLEKLLVKED